MFNTAVASFLLFFSQLATPIVVGNDGRSIVLYDGQALQISVKGEASPQRLSALPDCVGCFADTDVSSSGCDFSKNEVKRNGECRVTQSICQEFLPCYAEASVTFYVPMGGWAIINGNLLLGTGGNHTETVSVNHCGLTVNNSYVVIYPSGLTCEYYVMACCSGCSVYPPE